MNAVRLTTEDQLQESFRLRYGGWCDRISGVQGMGDNTWSDQIDLSDTVHFGVFDQQTLVASARISFHASKLDTPNGHMFDEISGSVGVLSRLVVHPSVRGQGLPGILDQARIEEAIERKPANLCAVSSNQRRISALKDAGFEVVRNGMLADHGIPVAALLRKLADT